MTGLRLLRAGPGLTVQDLGRPGWLSRGLSRGGAMDPLALAEGAALLGQGQELVAIEMAGTGGLFEATGPLRIALTGAPMRASVDGASIAWTASHALAPGQRLEIGRAVAGTYGYLNLGGGVATDPLLGARATHLAAHLGRPLAEGEAIPAGNNKGGPTGLTLDAPDRFSGGTLRLLPTAQTRDFPEATRDRLAATGFTRDPRSNRMAIRLRFEGAGFAEASGRAILSEITQPGDVQVTGDGTPVILMAEAQTTGGYPRIGTVLPADLVIAAQCPPGRPLNFRWIDVDEGLAAERKAAEALAALPRSVRPLIRDPRDIPDLLRYTLIDGVVTGRDE